MRPAGERTAVIFAAQGVMKNAPTSAMSTPCLSAYSSLAILAAASMGETKSITLSSSAGKLTWISRTMAGQAEEITGLGRSSSRIARLIA